MTVPTGRDSDKFMLRLPDGMRDRIKAAAEANNRSMNAEVVATLEATYPRVDIDIENSTMTEWLSYIDGSGDLEGRSGRIAELNEKLAASRHFRLKIKETEGREIYVGLSEPIIYFDPDEGRLKAKPGQDRK